MADTSFEYVVCGSTPLAGLVAGLLATAHGKRVCRFGENWSPYRLPRRFDLSVMPVTRPETWALLKRESAETLKLIGSLGRGLFERVDPLFVAETPASTDRLGHVRWMAAGFGFAAERAVDRGITETGTICRIRDGAMLLSGKIEPALDAWLEKAGVPHVNAAEAKLALKRDGGATITAGDSSIEAANVVLADDDAILGHLPASDRHRLLVVESGTSVLTEPAKSLGAALIHYLDRNVMVQQRANKGAVTALATGDADSAAARIGASLASLGRLRRSGQSVFRTVATADGAPLLGRMGKTKALVLAGLGPSAAFLAPTLARYIAGAADAEEQAWLEARDVARAGSRQAVAETQPAQLEMAS